MELLKKEHGSLCYVFTKYVKEKNGIFIKNMKKFKKHLDKAQALKFLNHIETNCL